LERWEKENPKTKNAVWDYAPGYELIPEVDVPLNHSWFIDGTHSCPPLDPFSLYEYWARGCGHGLKYINELLSIPGSYGTEGRTIDGAVYWCFYIVRDENERRKRGDRFREALKPFLDDYQGVWERNKKELSSIYQRLLSFNPQSARGIDYVHFHWDCIGSIFRVWELHFEGMQSANSGWLLLEEECKRRFGMAATSEEFQAMMAGFETDVYTIDREMWGLSKAAVDMGLLEVFKEKKPIELIPALQGSEKGKEWLDRFDKFLEVRGWRSVSSVSIADHYWKEEPTVPLHKIKNFIQTGEAQKGEYSLDEKRRELVLKREAAVENLIEKISEPERPWFRSLIKLAQAAGYYSEDHDLLCEMTHLAILRRSYLLMGKRLAEQGCIDRPEDVMFLVSPEIGMCLLVPQKNDMRWLTRRRRKQWEDLRARFFKGGEFRPPAYTDRANMQEAVGLDLLPSLDPIFICNVVGELPAISAEEVEADIIGVCGSGGIAEGSARVIMRYQDLHQLNPGEILVCPNTTPEWVPAFGIAAGVIADRGGTLSHTAIIAREYGLPAVVNTYVACEKIKTGDYIKIDATKGAVYIKKKAKGS
jgi:phosphohistidine swiveling domain-containing protein